MANIQQMAGGVYDTSRVGQGGMSGGMPNVPPNMPHNMGPDMGGNMGGTPGSMMHAPVPFDCSDIDSDDISVDEQSEGGGSDIEKTYTNLDGSRREMFNSTMIQQAFAQSIGLGLVQQAAQQAARQAADMGSHSQGASHSHMPFHGLQMPPRAPPPHIASTAGAVAVSAAASSTPKGRSEQANQPSGWTHQVRATPSPPFNAVQPGPGVLFPPGTPELNYFHSLFPESLMERLMIETNRFAEQSHADKANAHWQPLDLTEMKAYLGIRIYMSILSLPHQDMYWSTDWLFGNLACSQIMPKNRFQNIARNFSANDMTTNPPVTAPDHDKLHAIRTVLDTVLHTIKDTYHPHQNLCIDETIITYKGKLGWRQRSADGSTVGIKVWMRADSTNGYVNDFQFYTGKSQTGKVEGGLPTRVVLDLTKDLHNTNAIINMKGFFCSPYLLERLFDLGIRGRGTVKADRKDFPEAQLGSKSFTQHGQSAVVQKGNTCAYAWKDKRVVHVLSTADDATVTDNVTRKQRDGWVKPVPCPQAMSYCNKYLHGVSHANQLRLEYPSSRTSNKWWHYLFWFIFDTCMANAYIIMKETYMNANHGSLAGTRKMCTLEFKKNLAKQLVAPQMMTGKKRKSPDRSNNSPLKVKFKKVKSKSPKSDKKGDKKSDKKDSKSKSRRKRTPKKAKLADTSAAMFYPMQDGSLGAPIHEHEATEGIDALHDEVAQEGLSGTSTE
ncbi:piggyBac transposable element-derived protein 5 [Strongylocentrotus purpuratus]|uniref:PiggyBac transposable element-derived protein domain-containing protein n=1 Tax=Strongylocentrotus purpuratus TaxID=7668 RepID=A0A7M7GJI6_STRPU|nr:piggyBac transposable element-derived protein 5 [Strongylocentrotus purpuratus]